jgi:phosphoserine phosphatase
MNYFSHAISMIALSLLFVPCEENYSQQKAVDYNTPKEMKNFLPSWNDTETTTRIIDFVEMAAYEDSIPESDRIAVFDNDGTLWSEQPMYFQLYFAIDQVRAMAADHPEWSEEEPMRSVLNNDMASLKQQGMDGVMKLIMTTHAGMSEEDFKSSVKQWADTARHPETDKRYIDMVYQPMLQLLDYLEEKGFKTYIVSGGGVSFMRAWAPEVYGIPEERIIGSTIQTEFVSDSTGQKVMRKPSIGFIDDKEGKPENINRIIGKKPLMAFGNSDGDLAMLQYAASRQGPSMAVFIHHTDSVREWAYDRDSHIGQFNKGLDEAMAKDWILVNMKEDWKEIYPER